MNARIEIPTGDINVGVKIDLRDIWIGVYWRYAQSVESAFRTLDIYVCILPCLPVYFLFTWGWRK